MKILNNKFQVSCFMFYAMLFLFFPFISFAQGAIFISPSEGTYEVGELFSVLITANTGNQPINAGAGQINFDNQRLQVESIGYSRSIFNLWTEEPKFLNVGGTVRFSGGLPNPGFVGASGSILRVTFKAIATGQAPVVFTSGSLLANDGQGTNILDSLRGGLFNIVSKKNTKGEPIESKPESSTEGNKPAEIETGGRSFAPPIITEWPKKLEEGGYINIKGLGYPGYKVLLYVQYGSENPVEHELLALDDGRFFFTYEKPAEAGSYRIWAKNTYNGTISSPSETVSIDVVKPLFLRIGSVVFDYAAIIVTLVALVALFGAMILWIVLRFRKWQKRQGKEIHEAEEKVHESFDKLKTGLRHYVRYLTKGKTKKSIEKRAGSTEDELEKELETIEKDLEKEIEDIERPRKR